MIKKSGLITLTILLIILTTNLSCSKKTDLNNNIFRYNEHSNISSLDPIFSSTVRNIWPVNQIFNGLVQLDDSLNIKPDLAKKWNISTDGLTYEFTIRDDVFFHKSIHFGDSLTRRVVASDMTYSLGSVCSTSTPTFITCSSQSWS